MNYESINHTALFIVPIMIMIGLVLIYYIIKLITDIVQQRKIINKLKKEEAT